MDDKFTYQLTEWEEKEELLFVEDQLKEHDAKEDVDYTWLRNGDLWAIFIEKPVRVYTK